MNRNERERLDDNVGPSECVWQSQGIMRNAGEKERLNDNVAERE